MTCHILFGVFPCLAVAAWVQILLLVALLAGLVLLGYQNWGLLRPRLVWGEVRRADGTLRAELGNRGRKPADPHYTDVVLSTSRDEARFELYRGGMTKEGAVLGGQARFVEPLEVDVPEHRPFYAAFGTIYRVSPRLGLWGQATLVVEVPDEGPVEVLEQETRLRRGASFEPLPS